MLNTFISEKVRAWFQREDCPAADIIAYMVSAGHLRDAQIEAIKTYLFLKMSLEQPSTCRAILRGTDDTERGFVVSAD